jgi:hypothetical protein
MNNAFLLGMAFAWRKQAQALTCFEHWFRASTWRALLAHAPRTRLPNAAPDTPFCARLPPHTHTPLLLGVAITTLLTGMVSG